MKEQKFSALDSFADRAAISVWLHAGFYRITIHLDGSKIAWSTVDHNSVDGALTEALRYLRRITKPPKP